MAKEYDFKSIEEKWQSIWEKEKYGQAEDFSDKPKFYSLIEFPYPSGAGLHVGHCLMYASVDAHSRMMRMKGYNVMFPMGWDAFGLPTENYAIKNKIKPQVATAENIKTFKRQQKSLGCSFDWSREIDTTDPEYYKWTQWIFLQFYKHAIIDPSTGSGQVGKLVEVADEDTTTPRLAYQSEMPVNWCPSCKIVLANEEVVNGRCERCSAGAERRNQKQWMLRITLYADRLIDDLSKVDYLEKIKTQQINWIGRSEGAEINFNVVIPAKAGISSDEQDSRIKSENDNLMIKVFTTRPDTLFGCTYVVLAPEHPLVENIKYQISNIKEVENYIKDSRSKSDLERTELQKDKTGVELRGVKAINPINNKEVPVFIADYVLASYGTGAIMAVPAHDERDWEFAKKFDLPIIDVILPREGEEHTGEEFRRTVSAVIQRKSDGKFMLLKWPKFNWVSFPLGGIEDGETEEQALTREVHEETGYKIKPIRKLGNIIESHFYADHKKVWRSRHDQPYLCQLIEDEPEPVEDSEKNLHEVIWLTAEEALRQITHPYNKLGISRYINNNDAYTGEGVLINSGSFDGLKYDEAKEKIIDWLEKDGSGKKTINFKLRDWIFSRQHYWGEPIPIIHCPKCGAIPVPEDQLPVILPDVENYEPTDTGESPLAKITDWVETSCPKCGGRAKRETDTMPNWAGSSWYFMAYVLSQKLKEKSLKSMNIFLDGKQELEYWMPVDLYNGGMEHTTLHLLYSRFWHKFLYDLGAVPGSEPYAKRIAHGMVLGPDGQKMSKSRGNVINPDETIQKFGADTLRAYIMFIGPYDQDSVWNPTAVQGVYRFLSRVWSRNFKITKEDEDHNFKVKLNQTIKAVSENYDNFKFNTVVSKLMELNNEIEAKGKITEESYRKFLILLSPVAPHLTSELWAKCNFGGDITDQNWPKYDENFLISKILEIPVQINGKIRDRLQVNFDIDDDELKKIALESHKTKDFVKGKEVVKVIVVSKKLVSIVIK